jgi:hypothetical protein
MKIRSILGIASASLLALTTTRCNDDDKVSGLEELPKEIAANLKVVPNTDLLISMPPFEAKKPVVALAPKNCAPTELSYVQVIYPITICSPPDFSTNGLLKEYRVAPDRAPLPAPAGETQTYMLSSFEGKYLKKLNDLRTLVGDLIAGYHTPVKARKLLATKAGEAVIRETVPTRTKNRRPTRFDRCLIKTEAKSVREEIMGTQLTLPRIEVPNEPNEPNELWKRRAGVDTGSLGSY